jgi:hypothetical protein
MRMSSAPTVAAPPNPHNIGDRPTDFPQTCWPFGAGRFTQTGDSVSLSGERISSSECARIGGFVSAKHRAMRRIRF